VRAEPCVRLRDHLTKGFRRTPPGGRFSCGERSVVASGSVGTPCQRNAGNSWPVSGCSGASTADAETGTAWRGRSPGCNGSARGSPNDRGSPDAPIRSEGPIQFVAERSEELGRSDMARQLLGTTASLSSLESPAVASAADVAAHAAHRFWTRSAAATALSEDASSEDSWSGVADQRSPAASRSPARPTRSKMPGAENVRATNTVSVTPVIAKPLRNDWIT